MRVSAWTTGLEALAGDAFAVEHQPSGDGRRGDQGYVAVFEQGLDRLFAEDAFEIVVWVSGDVAQRIADRGWDQIDVDHGSPL